VVDEETRRYTGWFFLFLVNAMSYFSALTLLVVGKALGFQTCDIYSRGSDLEQMEVENWE